MFIIFAMPRTNEGDYLHRSLKNCCGVEPQQFLAKNFTQAHNYPKKNWLYRHTFLNSTVLWHGTPDLVSLHRGYKYFTPTFWMSSSKTPRMRKPIPYIINIQLIVASTENKCRRQGILKK
jgi:hypothetical protein